MSRSRKKNPYVSTACCGKGKAMRSAKTEAVRRIRRKIHAGEDIPSGNHYKKTEERYAWPDDGKKRWDNPRAYRK